MAAAAVKWQSPCDHHAAQTAQQEMYTAGCRGGTHLGRLGEAPQPLLQLPPSLLYQLRPARCHPNQMGRVGRAGRGGRVAQTTSSFQVCRQDKAQLTLSGHAQPDSAAQHNAPAPAPAPHLRFTPARLRRGGGSRPRIAAGPSSSFSCIPQAAVKISDTCGGVKKKTAAATTAPIHPPTIRHRPAPSTHPAVQGDEAGVAAAHAALARLALRRHHRHLYLRIREQGSGSGVEQQEGWTALGGERATAQGGRQGEQQQQGLQAATCLPQLPT